MSLTRRSFLKVLGGTAASVVAAPLIMPTTRLVTAPAAPLFIPAQRLDFGVPHEILSAQSMTSSQISDLWASQVERFDTLRAEAQMRRTIPMLLRQSEFLPQYGGKLAAGSTVLVDASTADRWVKNLIAVPGPTAPRAMQDEASRLLVAHNTAKKKSRRQYEGWA